MPNLATAVFTDDVGPVLLVVQNTIAPTDDEWGQYVANIRAAIETRAFDAARGSFMESFGGNDVEAGLLLMAEVGFLPRGDSRFAGTVDYQEAEETVLAKLRKLISAS